MNRVDAKTLLMIIHMLLDDWYQLQGHRLVPAMPGSKPEFSESKMLTLLLATNNFPYPGEQQFLGFIRANYLSLFPQLLDQIHFNRWARRIEGLVEELRHFWVKELGARVSAPCCWTPNLCPLWDISAARSRVNFRTHIRRDL